MSQQETRTPRARNRSFLPSLSVRAANYRTPSPPIGLYEPFTPITEHAATPYQQWPTDTLTSRHPRQVRHTSGQQYNNNGWPIHHSPYLGAPHIASPNNFNLHNSPSVHGSRGSQTPLDLFATLATSPALGAGTMQRSGTAPLFPVQPAGYSPHGPGAAPIDAERPYKRARSNNGGYNAVGQNGYRALGSNVHGSPTEASMEDAELLLGFVHALTAPASRVQQPTHLPPPAPAPVPIDHTVSQPAVPAPLPSPPQQAPILATPEVKEERVQPEAQTLVTENDIPQPLTEQTQPLEIPPAIDPDATDTQTSPEMNDTKEDMQNVTEQKTRVYKGWPKGKPRGPRQTPYAKRGTKSVVKRGQQDGGAGQGSVSGSAGSPALSTADLPMEGDEDGNEAVDPTLEDILAFDDGEQTLPSEVVDETVMEVAAPPPPAPSIPLAAGHDEAKTIPIAKASTPKLATDDLCASCGNIRTSDLHDFWISCNGCKSWFHHTCVGFKTEREVKDVDKFYCKSCERRFGTTTFVRKSARAHASIDYAGLNEGKIRTSTDVPDHIYVKPIKEGTLKIQPEFFPRMPPELVTAEYFERVGTMAEPVVIPAWMNPRPALPGTAATTLLADSEGEVSAVPTEQETPLGAVEHLSKDFEYDYVPDVGQDKLDMVIPQGLTVRMVAELYGPDEKVEVIDVKNQEGEDKRWNMRQWADYYEATGQKPVRNVISLEVSQSKLGRLIQRPKIVRDLDLQDSVWPEDEQQKGMFPKVQFYCLMSVANCYTDFHIDFGGSSVYYHVLHGQKTFFFIPPKKEHLKKYEEWCLSADQNSTFLGDWTKECYRVDLTAGDTMLIPSGWIHAVWTPVDTLVIGGNFLTRMHYGMQIQINEIERNTGVGRKFRYPHFQKVMWYTMYRYLERDPVPSTVAEALLNHQQFKRTSPVWHDFDSGDGVISEDPELYNERYYSKGEMEGLPDLMRFIFRTVMIAMNKVQGITKTTQEAVTRSLPKGYGDHFESACTFAMWVAWKRGNEALPSWAFPNAVVADIESDAPTKKMSAAALKRMERQTTKEGSLSDRRWSARQASTIPPVKEASGQPEQLPQVLDDKAAVLMDVKDPSSAGRRACDPCRKRRIRCKHKGDEDTVFDLSQRFGIIMTGPPRSALPAELPLLQSAELVPNATSGMPIMQPMVAPMAPMVPIAPMLAVTTEDVVTPARVSDVLSPSSADTSSSASKRPRVKACDDCRKSKRRCIHDEAGQVDPVKAQDAARGVATNAKRKSEVNHEKVEFKKMKRESDASETHAPLEGLSDQHVASAEQLPMPYTPVSTIKAPSPVPGLSFAQDNQFINGAASAAAPDLIMPSGTTAAITTDISTTQSTEPAEPTDSRTPSLHIQTTTTTNTNTTSTESGTHSTSPTSSPLTDLNLDLDHDLDSPNLPQGQPPQPQQPAAAVSVKEEYPAPPPPLRTPRQREQIDRFSTTIFESQPHSQHPLHTSPPAKSSTTPKPATTSPTFAKPASATRRKSSAPSRSQSQSHSRAASLSAASPRGSVGRDRDRAGSEIGGKEGKEEEVEDESLRLARELSGAEFGLRRRVGSGSG